MKFLFIFLFVCKAAGAQSQDSNFTKVSEKDIYDNFIRRPVAQNYYITIRSQLSGKILFEGDVNSQNVLLKYDLITKKADSCLNENNFQDAIVLFTTAFRINDDKGKVKHRFSAACSYVQVSNFDDAFEQLNKIVVKGNYYNYEKLDENKCLEKLHIDKRWKDLMDKTKSNFKKIQEELNEKTRKEQFNQN